MASAAMLGDGATDVFNGGADTDDIEVAGSDGGDAIVLTGNVAGIQGSVSNGIGTGLDFTAVESIAIDLAEGDDSFTYEEASLPIIATSDGGDGTDTVIYDGTQNVTIDVSTPGGQLRTRQGSDNYAASTVAATGAGPPVHPSTISRTPPPARATTFLSAPQRTTC